MLEWKIYVFKCGESDGLIRGGLGLQRWPWSGSYKVASDKGLSGGLLGA